jgi:hypothetical protein
VTTKCATWVKWADMDPGLYKEIDGKTQCRYGHDAAGQLCKAPCAQIGGVAIGTTSSGLAPVEYKCTCIDKETASKSLNAALSFRWSVGWCVLAVGMISSAVSGFCLSAFCSIRNQMQRDYTSLDASENPKQPATSEPAEGMDPVSLGRGSADQNHRVCQQPNNGPLWCFSTILVFSLFILLAGILLLTWTPGGGYFIGCGEGAAQRYE